MTGRTPCQYFVVLAICMAAFAGCGHYLAVDTANPHRAYMAECGGTGSAVGTEGGGEASGPSNLAARFCPVFVVQSDRPENLIGRVKAVKGKGEKAEIAVDTNDPAVYFEEKSVIVGGKNFTNLVYRVHFPNTPYSLVPFILTAGKNPGIMLIVTLNEARKPILVTTVHTCGCYAAVIPTTNLDPKFLPEGHPQGFQKVYGERLPAMLDFKSADARLVAVLRPGVHRLMELTVAGASELAGDGAGAGKSMKPVAMKLLPMDGLRRLALPDGGTMSFFHDMGILRGHVKGSVKPFETLLMSWMALDLFVGSDKDYATDLTDNPFYTSLKPWNRHASDLWDFPAFLKFMGYRFD